MSKTYQPQVYIIRALTNLHVGGGSSNYDYVDKQVQRDPTTNYPTIFSSSLKGALRDFIAIEDKADTFCSHVFGNEAFIKKKDKAGKEIKVEAKAKQGAYRFLSADLLAIPKPSVDADKGYELVYLETVKKAFEDKIELMGKKDFTVPEAHVGTKTDKDSFGLLVNELPVLSRNNLENGVSKNLWYEEVVPREAVFGFVILAQEGDEHFKTFNELLTANVIQIGANATIGYGLCKLQKI